MLMGRMRMALCTVRRTDAPLPQAHGRQTVQVSPLRPLLLKVRPPGITHEAARVDGASVAVSSSARRPLPHASLPSFRVVDVTNQRGQSSECVVTLLPKMNRTCGKHHSYTLTTKLSTLVFNPASILFPSYPRLNCILLQTSTYLHMLLPFRRIYR